MNKYPLRSSALLIPLCLILALVACSVVHAQGRGDVRIEFKEIDIRFQRSPDFKDDGYVKAQGAEPLEWLQIVAEYATETRGSDGWLDGLTLKWHVLLLGGKTERLYFTETVDYMDIIDGDEHYAIVYLRPRAIRRHFEEHGRVTPRDIAVYVEALVNNVRVADFTYNKTRQSLPDNWWRSPTLNKVENALLSRDKTPFGHMDYDFFEAIRAAR
jgi:hypothetical protein